MSYGQTADISSYRVALLLKKEMENLKEVKMYKQKKEKGKSRGNGKQGRKVMEEKRIRKIQDNYIVRCRNNINR